MTNPVWLEAPISPPELGAVFEVPLNSAEAGAGIGFSWFTKINGWGNHNKCSLCAGMKKQSLKRFWGNAEYI